MTHSTSNRTSIYRIHQPNTPTEHTNRIHQPNTPTESTNRIHQPNTPTEHPNRMHHPYTLTEYTNRIHQPNPPTEHTNRIHQPNTPTEFTNRIHQPRLDFFAPGNPWRCLPTLRLRLVRNWKWLSTPIASFKLRMLLLDTSNSSRNLNLRKLPLSDEMRLSYVWFIWSKVRQTVLWTSVGIAVIYLKGG